MQLSCTQRVLGLACRACSSARRQQAVASALVASALAAKHSAVHHCCLGWAFRLREGGLPKEPGYAPSLRMKELEAYPGVVVRCLLLGLGLRLNLEEQQKPILACHSQAYQHVPHTQFHCLQGMVRAQTLHSIAFHFPLL